MATSVLGLRGCRSAGCLPTASWRQRVATPSSPLLLTRVLPQPGTGLVGLAAGGRAAAQQRLQRQRLQQRPGLRVPRPAASAGGDKPAADPPAGADHKAQRTLAYTLLTFLLGALGLAQAVVPEQFVEMVYRATPLAVPAGLLRLVGGTCLMAAVAANCLEEAAEHDRLGSETYQRLNLGLLLWALGCLTVSWLGRGKAVFAVPLAQGLWTALMSATAVTTAVTYHQTSPEGFNPPIILAKTLESAGATWDLSSVNTFAYGLGALLTGFGGVAILVGKLPVLQAPRLAAPLGSLGFLFLKLMGVGMLLATVVWYTLKDAAARGRLGASTFKALNAGAALVCLNNLLVLTSFLRKGLVELHGLRSPVVTASAALLAVSLYNYFLAKK